MRNIGYGFIFQKLYWAACLMSRQTIGTVYTFTAQLRLTVCNQKKPYCAMLAIPKARLPPASQRCKRYRQRIAKRAGELERDLLGKDHVYLTRFAKPLREAIGQAQDMLPGFDTSPDMDTCDSGYCWV